MGEISLRIPWAFPIPIGNCAVIRDPFGTRLCILDMTKGPRPLNLAGSSLVRSDDPEQV